MPWQNSVALEDPARYAATVFGEVLAARGILVSGAVETSSDPLPPGVRVLATSRRPFGITGETAWPVPPLAVPPAGARGPEIAASPAVALFCDRAGAVPLGKLLSMPLTLSPRLLVERDPKKIAAADFRLAGIAGANGSWKAYGRVLGSSKFVFAAAPGTSLLDASVAAVAADRVTLHTTGGRDVVVALP